MNDIQEVGGGRWRPWGPSPSPRDLVVAALLLCVAHAVTPTDLVLAGGRPHTDGWLVLLVPAGLVLPVYTLLARRRPGGTAAGPALLCGALLLLTALVPAAGIGILCYLVGVLLRRPFRTGAGRVPGRGPDSARRDERLRLRRTLHDEVGPALLGIRLRLDTAAGQLAHDPRARQLVAEAADETGRVVRDLRRIVAGAADTALDGVRLPDALRQLVSRMSSPVPITLDVPEDAPRLPPTTEAAAYRIAAEGLTNALRHAAADRIDIRLRVGATAVVLEVLDDGTGLAPDAAHRSGTGLRSVRQRAAAVGGRCTVGRRTDRPGGTALRAVLPRSAG